MGTGRRAGAGMETGMLEMRGIRKVFGATVALDGVDLAVRPGSVLALSGKMGPARALW